MDAGRMHALACQYALAPTPESLQAALEAALPLCAAIARRFSRRGAEYDDLYQTACLAAMGALQRFDPIRGLKFTTYLTPTVTGAVRNEVRDRGALLRTPRALKQQAAQLARVREEFLARSRREPCARELAEALGWELAQVLDALAAARGETPLSLDRESVEGPSLMEQWPFTEQGFDRMEQRADLTRALRTLSDTERKLLSLRYRQGLSQREAARRLDMTQMQVSRLERRALAALRKEMTPQA